MYLPTVPKNREMIRGNNKKVHQMVVVVKELREEMEMMEMLEMLEIMEMLELVELLVEMVEMMEEDCFKNKMEIEM